MNISLIHKLFFWKQKKQLKENIPGTCQRCKREIKPFEACCILGYDSKKGKHTRDECDKIICFRCTETLGFEHNAIHVSDNNSQPTLFFSVKQIEELQKIEQEIHQKSSANKKKGLTRKKKSRRKRNIKKHHQ